VEKVSERCLVYEEDLARTVAKDYVPWNHLRGKVIYIDGASGLIGKTLIDSLLAADIFYDLNMTIIAGSRKAKPFQSRVYQDYHLLTVDSESADCSLFPDVIDYVIHCASPTDSAYFLNEPVETIQSIYHGTITTLELARNFHSTKYVFLSTMEIYGAQMDEKLIHEESPSYLNLQNPRDCYGEAKRVGESLAVSYFKEYGVGTSIVRLAQCFGPGIKMNDNRLFAYLIRCMINNEDVVLKTKGNSKRPYIYTFDAVSAIITVLLKGKDGQAYNVSNESTYCSIYEMVSMFIQTYAPKLEINYELNEGADHLMKNHFLKISSGKLQELGWVPDIGLKQMFQRSIAFMEDVNA